MKTQEETPMDEITLTEMLKEVFLHNKQMQDFMSAYSGAYLTTIPTQSLPWIPTHSLPAFRR
jgi:hypothetical protein